MLAVVIAPCSHCASALNAQGRVVYFSAACGAVIARTLKKPGSSGDFQDEGHIQECM